MKFSHIAGLALFIAMLATSGSAQPDLEPDSDTETNEPAFNIPLPTLGGAQVWSDVALVGGWRIQENALTGHCRVLDDENVRQAWDPSGECGGYLNGARTEHNLAFIANHLVILLHGIARPRSSMADLQTALEGAGFQAAAISYASTRLDLDTHAENLIRLLNSLDGIAKVSFVTHSMGGLVARTTLARDDWPEHIAKAGLVMLAPPSSGALLADRYARFTAFKLIAGPAGEQLDTDEAAQVPLPGIRNCIIAGGRGDADGFNPYLPGDDDGIVRVEEARLPGGDDFVLVESLHNFIMTDPAAQAATLRFLGGERCDGEGT